MAVKVWKKQSISPEQRDKLIERIKDGDHLPTRVHTEVQRTMFGPSVTTTREGNKRLTEGKTTHEISINESRIKWGPHEDNLKTQKTSFEVEVRTTPGVMGSESITIATLFHDTHHFFPETGIENVNYRVITGEFIDSIDGNEIAILIYTDSGIELNIYGYEPTDIGKS